MRRRRVIILGAAGRDFHNFNTVFRDDDEYEVVAFTANQIPFISDRDYPGELAGRLYTKGIHIYEESELPSLIRNFQADLCVMAYSDLSYEEVMRKASIANACGSDFWLLSPMHTMIKSGKPVIAVCAVRTGCGKSQTSRYLSLMLRKMGFKVAIIRHPMPYGMLREQAVQRFESLRDLDRYKATIEEREDYEPHIRNGFVVYAGVDYARVLREAERDNDVILWDGGNNDTPFIHPDLLITVADPLRKGSVSGYYPGETVARMADVLLINKANSATKRELEQARLDLREVNNAAAIILADSEVYVEKAEAVSKKRVLLVEDGPTLTHGGMSFGAAAVAARRYGAGKIVEAKRYVVGVIKKTFEKYPSLKYELPAVGYSKREIRDLEATINKAPCDVVLSATPTDLRRLIKVNKPIIQVYYDLKPRGDALDRIIKEFAGKIRRWRV